MKYGTGGDYIEHDTLCILSLNIIIEKVSITIVCHCRGDNTLYKTCWFYNFLTRSDVWNLKWCLKFQTSLFWPQNGPKKARAPLKVSRDHLESLKWPHLVIFRGWFDNAPPHLQYRDIDSYNSDPERRREGQYRREKYPDFLHRLFLGPFRILEMAPFSDFQGLIW